MEAAAAPVRTAVEEYSGRSAFPPIADYAFLSDCETVALMAPSGNVEWMCLPRLDGPSVFGSILDRDAGGFRLGPADVVVPAGRRYVPGTNVLETTWQTRMGWLIVRDAPVGGAVARRGRALAHAPPRPTDDDAEHVLIRKVFCVQGTVELQLDCEPNFDYGRAGAQWEYTGEGYNEAVATAEGSDIRLKLTTDLRIGFEGRRARARHTLREGEVAYAALSWSEHSAPSDFEEASKRMLRTEEFWRQWLNHGLFPDHPWRVYLQRSALTLKGLTYAPTGAMLAAATTSLPGDARRRAQLGLPLQLDPRLHVHALGPLHPRLRLGGERLLLLRRRRRGGGRGGPPDHVRDRGREEARGAGARPPPATRARGRCGSATARTTRSSTTSGAPCSTPCTCTRSRDLLPESVWPILVRQVEAALENWTQPDSGIWEVRGEPKHFTSSKLMCWVAADRGARLARLREDDESADRWEAGAKEIHADICANALDDRGVFTQHYETDALDASVLLMPLVRFLPPDDERVRATVLAIADELTEDGLVLRYRVEETDDGLSGKEGTFAICSFWLVSALAEIEEQRRARQLCERMLSYASPLYLYAEEIDPSTGPPPGQLPRRRSRIWP